MSFRTFGGRAVPDFLDAAVRLARLRRRMFGRVDAPSIGGFDLLRKVGEGRRGIVYAAWDPVLDRLVAVRLLRDGDALRSEAGALVRLRHANVVPVHAVGRHRGRVFLAMEYVEGETARAWMGRRHPLDAVLRVFGPAARGLAAAHAVGMVHRDVKPETIVVGVDGRARLTDFGLAPAEAGTPGYAAPEVSVGGPPSPAADQFALAACLFEALTGRHLGSALDRVPRALRPALARALHRDPARRWPSAAVFADELERAQDRAR